MATITEPMALDASFNTTETNPRNIADVLAEMGEAIAQGMGRQANEVSYDNTTSGLSADDVQEAIDELADEKVDKVNGKGLSTNDYTDAEKTKLAGIAAGAEVNVPADWAQTDSSADDFVKNKQLVTDPIEELQNDVQSTQTATGNPLTLTDCAPINAESLVVELEPKQDLHGQSAPYVGGAGKNKLPMTVDGIKAANTAGTWSGNVYTLNSGTFTILTDDGENVTGIKIHGTFTGNLAFYVARNISMESNSYILSVTQAVGTGASVYAITPSGNKEISADTSVSFTDSVTGCAVFITANKAFTNYVLQPMIRLSTESDSTFAPYSNICPITGYTECGVDDVGFNQWDEEWEVGDIDNNGQPQSSSTLIRTKNFNPCQPSTTYYVKTPTGISIYFKYYDKNKNFISPTVTPVNNTITTPSNCVYFKFVIGSAYGTTYNHDICINISKTEGTPKNGDYVPYHSSNATIQFGQTVYGGVSDFVEGGTESKKYSYSLTGTETNIYKHSTYPDVFGIYMQDIVTSLGGVVGDGGTLVYRGHCSAFIPSGYTQASQILDHHTDSYVGLFGNVLIQGIWFKFRESTFADLTVEQLKAKLAEWYVAGTPLQYVFDIVSTDIATPATPLKLLKGTNNLSADGNMELGYQPNNVIGEVKGEIENATPISGTVTATLLHEEDQGEDWIVGFTGEINGHFDTNHFDYYLTARYTHAYNDNTQILNMNNCSDGDYVQIWQTGTLDFSVDGGVTVDISVTDTKLTFAVNCIGDSIFGIYSSSETTGQVKYLITPARKG